MHLPRRCHGLVTKRQTRFIKVWKFSTKMSFPLTYCIQSATSTTGDWCVKQTTRSVSQTGTPCFCQQITLHEYLLICDTCKCTKYVKVMKNKRRWKASLLTQCFFEFTQCFNILLPYKSLRYLYILKIYINHIFLIYYVYRKCL